MGAKSISKIYFWTVAAIFVGGLLWSGWAQRSYFPFYPWMMYAGTTSGDEFRTFKSFCTDKEGKEFAVTDLDLWDQEMNFYYPMESLLSAVAPLNEEQKEICRSAMKPFVNYLEKYCAKISVYRLYWAKFTGPQVNNPTEKVLMCELEVQP